MPPKPSSSIATKWPGSLLKSGFIPVSRIFLRNYRRLWPEITDFEAILVIDLVDYMWREAKAFPSWQKLATDLAVPSGVIEETLGKLNEKGYLEFVPIEGTGGRAYTLNGLYSRLESLIESGHAWVGSDSKPTDAESGTTEPKDR